MAQVTKIVSDTDTLLSTSAPTKFAETNNGPN